MSSHIVNKKQVICKFNSKETFYKWWHFRLALIFYLKYCLRYFENHVPPTTLDLCGVQTLKYPNWHWSSFLLVTSYECLFWPLGKILQLKREEHQYLLTPSFPHLFESCLKIRKGRGYKSILVKLTVRPALALYLSELLCCYQEKSYQPTQKIHKIFWSWNCSFLEVVHIVSILWKHETKHYSILLMIP